VSSPPQVLDCNDYVVVNGSRKMRQTTDRDSPPVRGQVPHFVNLLFGRKLFGQVFILQTVLDRASFNHYRQKIIPPNNVQKKIGTKRL
jgi:hypothetical protein